MIGCAGSPPELPPPAGTNTSGATAMVADDGVASSGATTADDSDSSDSNGSETTTEQGDATGSTGFVHGTGDSGDVGTQSGSTTAGTPDAPYPACAPDGTCPLGSACLNANLGGTVFTICRPSCESADECPSPPEGDAVPICNEQGRCMLACVDDASCPEGMLCPTFGQQGPFCAWPG